MSDALVHYVESLEKRLDEYKDVYHDAMIARGEVREELKAAREAINAARDAIDATFLLLGGEAEDE